MLFTRVSLAITPRLTERLEPALVTTIVHEGEVYELNGVDLLLHPGHEWREVCVSAARPEAELGVSFWGLEWRVQARWEGEEQASLATLQWLQRTLLEEAAGLEACWPPAPPRACSRLHLAPRFVSPGNGARLPLSLVVSCLQSARRPLDLRAPRVPLGALVLDDDDDHEEDPPVEPRRALRLEWVEQRHTGEDVAVLADGRRSARVRATGLCADAASWALLSPGLALELRCRARLARLPAALQAAFPEAEADARTLLRRALTHPSFARQPASWLRARRAAWLRTGLLRRRGREAGGRELRLELEEEGEEEQGHNQRLEFLGDAVLEFLVSTGLLASLPGTASTGELTRFRAALVNNAHLSELARRAGLEPVLLHADAPEFRKPGPARRHMLADALEALLGALYLQRGLEVCRAFLADLLFPEDADAPLRCAWTRPPPAPAPAPPPPPRTDGGGSSGSGQEGVEQQLEERLGRLEERIGVRFRSRTLLRQAFTHASVLQAAPQETSNERLEFLGDAVLQLLVSRLLYALLPDLGEGPLTLARAALVNNAALTRVSRQLGLPQFLRYLPSAQGPASSDAGPSQALAADTLEALIGALYLDRGLAPAEALLRACLLPRLPTALAARGFCDPRLLLPRSLELRDIALPPPHSPAFFFAAGIFDEDGTLLACARARSRSGAHLLAATRAYRLLGLDPPARFDLCK